MEKLEGVPSEGRYSPHGNYDIRFRLLVVKEIEEGLPIAAARAKYSLSKSTVYRWLDEYRHPGLRSVGRRKLSVQDKRTIVRAVTSGNLSIKEAAGAHEVSTRAIQNWQDQFVEEKPVLSLSNQDQLGKKKTKQKPDTNSDQLQQVQQQLADAQLKIAALNTLIDVAEEQLKIDIRKKPGARQS